MRRDNAAVPRFTQQESGICPGAGQNRSTVAPENWPRAVGGALTCRTSFGSDNRQKAIALSCAAMANHTLRFWMASHNKTLSGRRVLLQRCGPKSQSLDSAGTPALGVQSTEVISLIQTWAPQWLGAAGWRGSF